MAHMHLNPELVRKEGNSKGKQKPPTHAQSQTHQQVVKGRLVGEPKLNAYSI